MSGPIVGQLMDPRRMGQRMVVGVQGDPQASSTGALQSLGTLYQQQADKANYANESRYRDILSRYSGLRDRTLGALGQRSDVAERDIASAYDAAAAAGDQRMTTRGLYNSTIAETMRQGSEQKKSEAINRYRDDVLDRTIGYDIGTTNPMLGFMERRTDRGPDPSILMGLAQMMGQAGPQGVAPGILDIYKSLLGGGGYGGSGPQLI